MIISKEQVDQVFEEAKHQEDYIVALYKQAFPDWDDITCIKGHPECGEKLSFYVWDKAIEFDKKHHNSFPGGLWLNKGFFTNKKLKAWEISTLQCKVTVQDCSIL